MTPLIKQRPPRGFWRRLCRLPVSLYRARLGWLLGERFLLLTHIGRKTGRPRETVLEVVHHDTGTDTYFIASGWGEKSDWMRNVQQEPMVSVNVGRRHFVAMAKRFSIEQAQGALLASARQHSWVFPMLAKLILGRRLKPTEEDCLILAQSMPVVGLIRLDTYGNRITGSGKRQSHVNGSIHWFMNIGSHTRLHGRGKIK